MAGDAYTGLKRRKQTPWSVRFGDALASRIIAVGGIGTIAAILLVVLVLIGTAFPLLFSPKFDSWRSLKTAGYTHAGVDDGGSLLWGVDEVGNIEVRNLFTGDVLQTLSSPFAGDGPKPTCLNLTIDRTTLAVGLDDGSFCTVDLNFESRLLARDSLKREVVITPEQPFFWDGSELFEVVESLGVRATRLAEIKWSTPQQLSESAITAIDFLPDASANRLSQSSKHRILASTANDLIYGEISSKRNLLTKKVVQDVKTHSATLEARNVSRKPLSIMLMNGGEQSLVVWDTGTIDRYVVRDGQFRLIESQGIAGNAAKIVSAAPLLARETALCGLDDGRLQGWMITRPDSVSTDSVDGQRLTLAHEVKVSDSPLVSVASSEQTHVAVAGDSQAMAAIVYMTTDSLLAKQSVPTDGSEIRSVNFDHAGDTLIAVSNDAVSLCNFDIGHPEASWTSYFSRVWYEGHDRPKYIWQSSAGTEKSEIKLSLVPLVFGTLKATVYAMLISVPLAILAAIYTSEFLNPRTRGRIKPAIELMASLPSVVLGYIAALVIAPFMQEHLLEILLMLLFVPLTFVTAGTLWTLLPVDVMIRLQPLRLVAMLVCLPIAITKAWWLAPTVEGWLFDGSLVRWLSSDVGSATGGWMLLLIPLLLLLAALIAFGPLSERTRLLAIRSTPRQYALFGIARLMVMVFLAVATAYGLGAILGTIGLDLRDGLFDTYQDRNALLVGGALGFCVIPIIYTIADDALQAVPNQLRSASLGCGATPWQTTMRVVVPSAMSGLFSAIMIGLGRAVGETMVVLMAAGNTPVMEWNPFNGFRTLSATLATELPEAAKGSTHFRTLFLAALLLFFLTLIANTFAEYVRIRFRKRASQL